MIDDIVPVVNWAHARPEREVVNGRRRRRRGRRRDHREMMTTRSSSTTPGQRSTMEGIRGGGRIGRCRGGGVGPAPAAVGRRAGRRRVVPLGSGIVRKREGVD